MKTDNAGYVISTYPCVPPFHQGNEEEEKDFQRQLSETPDILGLEQPCLENFHPLGDQQLLRYTPKNWKFIVTVVIEIMRRHSENNGFGLASNGEEQCQTCVAYYHHLFSKISSLQANKVLALELQVVPLATNPNAIQTTDASARSLREIASWDWSCKLVPGHCDTVTLSPPRGGFLPLKNVLEIVTDYDINICIDWVHSAIEGCNTTLPSTHTQMAKQVGKLDALMFFSTTLNGAYSEWQDLYAPFASFCAESLMAIDHVRKLFNVAESSTSYFAGTKLLEINATVDVCHRIEILRNDIHSLNESR